MADPTPPTSDGDPDAGTPPAPDSTPPNGAPSDASTSEAASSAGAPRRGAHRAPAKPQRVLVVGLIAVAAVVALLVAFGSCGGGFDSGQGVVNGTPGVTTAPPTTATPTTTGSPSPTATSTTTAPTTTAPTTTRPATSAPPTTPTRTTKPPTATPSPSPTSGPRIPVDVLNGTTIPGLAAQGATQVRAAGWTVASIGNWRATTVSTETVFYGPGDEGSARRLARELSGAQQVKKALSGMSTSKLTLVVLP